MSKNPFSMLEGFYFLFWSKLSKFFEDTILPLRIAKYPEARNLLNFEGLPTLLLGYLRCEA
jgi:hypothetical protein